MSGNESIQWFENKQDGEAWCITYFINPLHATGLFLYPRKTSEGYRKRPVAWNGLRAILSWLFLTSNSDNSVF